MATSRVLAEPADRDGPDRASDQVVPPNVRGAKIALGDGRFLAVVTATFLAALLVGTIVNPLFLIPDERFHADLVVLAGDVSTVSREGWPLVGERRIGPQIARASRVQSPTIRHRSDNAPPRGDRDPLSAWDDDEVRGRDNRMTQHPPLYYGVVAAGTAVADVLVPGSFAYDVELWVMRLVNVIMLLPIPVTTYLIAHQLTSSRAVRLSAATLPFGVVGLTLRNGPIINNDNLLTGLGVVFTYLLVRIGRGDVRTRITGPAGVLAGLMMLTKGFGLLLFGLLAGVLGWRLVVAWRTPSQRRDVLKNGSVAAVLAVLAGGWWYVRMYLATGQVRQAWVQRAPLEGFETDWIHWAQTVLWNTWSTFWGGNFALGTARFRELLALLVALTLIPVAVALVRSERRRDIVLALLPVLIIALALHANQAWNYANKGRIGATQGRYYYAGISGLLAVVVVGAQAVVGRARRFLPTSITIGGGALFIFTFQEMVYRYWGTGDLTDRLDALFAWSPLVPPAIVGFAVLFVVMLMTQVVMAISIGSGRL